MKAVSLFSGGLDSQLAVALIQKQGIEVTGVNFITPFFALKSYVSEAAAALKIDLVTEDISEEYRDKVLLKPVYGYGQHMNPCIDCHAFMLKNARRVMDEIGASFLITGEVLGQRPMSQNRSALKAVDSLSGQAGLIVRPLSALLMEPTIPETQGWIDRSQLLDISGRSRKRQMELAEETGINEYPSPAGGCLLTDENYSRRLKYILTVKPDAGTDDFRILSWGRHFIINDALLIIGRNQKENRLIMEGARPGDLLLVAPDFPGPTALLKGGGVNYDLEYAARIVARYGDGKNHPEVMVKIFKADGEILQIIPVIPFKPEEIPATL